MKNFILINILLLIPFSSFAQAKDKNTDSTVFNPSYNLSIGCQIEHSFNSRPFIQYSAFLLRGPQEELATMLGVGVVVDSAAVVAISVNPLTMPIEKFSIQFGLNIPVIGLKSQLEGHSPNIAASIGYFF
jgi:hypothetical protein